MAADNARLQVERDAAQAALVSMGRKYERLQSALRGMIETCGEHVEDVLSEEDSPDFFEAIAEARAALTESVQ